MKTEPERIHDLVPATADCVVMGGGPAGSAFAGIVKKYAPELSVVVLEKARFPRWHIGETTIPVVNGVLEDLGVRERMDRAGFVPKMGVTFVWGQDREPWQADFLTVRDVGRNARPDDVIDVTGQTFEAVQGASSSRPYTAFNMLRAEFDQILLERARELGARVHEGHRVRSVRRVEGTDAHDVAWQRDDGHTGTIRAGFVLDATGLSHLMSRGSRERDDTLNNLAVFGYLQGADWKVTFNGTRDASTVFIAAIEHGWIWYFPVAPDVMSVGVVTNVERFTEAARRALQGIDLEAWLWSQLRACPEIRGLVEHATLREDILPGGKRVSSCRDWSSWARTPVGEGWAAAGDAAMFVDPILSTGVTLALQTGHRAAYTYLSGRDQPAALRRELWGAYVRYLHAEYGAYRTLARYFYGNERSTRSWWWEAQKLVNAEGRLDLSDREAFVMAAAGFFPAARAFGTNGEVVCSMLERLGRPKADLFALYRDTGVPELDALEHHRFEPTARFRLALRAEPGLELGRRGTLAVFHDLHTDDEGMAHRLSARPARIPAVLAPVVEHMQAPGEVRELLRRGHELLASSIPEPERRKALVLQLVSIAAEKGLLKLHPGPGERRDAASTAGLGPVPVEAG